MSKLYGLIGYPIHHSFSQRYFRELFRNAGLHDHDYELFPLPDISALPSLLRKHPELCGLNVTIPHKQAVFPYLDRIAVAAQQVGAVNTIYVRDSALTGYNTDVTGFMQSLQPLLKKDHRQALILGTGGAAQAVAFALRQLKVGYTFVSRNPKDKTQTIGYQALDHEAMLAATLIINATPLGMWPETKSCPKIPYQLLTKHHLLYDLVYNPPTTRFMQEGATHGAQVQNGVEMLTKQAEAAWKVWREDC